MAIVQSSDPFVTVAVWTGLVALGLTLLLSLQIIQLRVSLRKRERHEARLEEALRLLAGPLVAAAREA